MMIEDIRRNMPELRRCHGNAMADFGMLFHDGPFLLTQVGGFIQDVIVNANLAYIMKLR